MKAYGNWDIEGLKILIPKRRGSGFLKCPVGHHRDGTITDLSIELRCDISGIDGYLIIETHNSSYCRFKESDRNHIETTAIPVLKEKFGFTEFEIKNHGTWWDIFESQGKCLTKTNSL